MKNNINNKKVKKYWVIERHHEHCNDKKILAIFDSRTNYDKIMSAMKTLMMSECNNVKDMLDIKNMTLKKDSINSPHLYGGKYPIIIGFGTMYYKAPYKAWITEFNIETGEYLDVDTMLLKYPEI